MNKEEAEKKRDELNKEKPSWFCPLTSHACRGDCVCYSAAVISVNNNVRVPQCDNMMFYRECSI